KDNIGEATLTGTQGFSGGTTVNGGGLTVAGALETPTVGLADDTVLNVTGTLQGNAGGYASITGSAGVNTVNVAASALLQAGGDLGDGSDVLDVAGTLDTGGTVFGMGAGDDTFVVHDTTAVLGTVDGGAGNDLLNVDVSTGNLVPLGSMLGFESLGKSGDGTLQINGPSSFIDVDLSAGTLEVNATGSVAAQNTTVAAGSTLQVDGSYNGTVGNDTMVVAGTVSGSGTVALGDGDDTFTIQDGADLSGLLTPVDGGIGTDAFVADLAGEATLGGAVNFETLNKTNTGTLHVDGPAPSSFITVDVDGGTLDVGATGSIGGVTSTTVAGGATLNVDGSYLGSAGNDSMGVSGTIGGNGLIGFGDDDDTLTLHDGADLGGFTGLLDGGADSGGDTIVLDNAANLVFGTGAIVDFEVLSKQNIGTATLVGNQAYGVRAEVMQGSLVVAGSLATPQVVLADDTALTVDGTLDAGGGNPAAITGSAGANTVTVNGTAIATGDLGGGNDTLDVVGTLDTGGGAFALGDGDDSFVVHDGTVVVGTVDGGAGLDTRVYDINATADLGALVNFEGVTKTGTGTLNINGPAATELQSVDVLGGTLNIGPDGSVVATAGGTLDTVVGSGATLNVDGSFGCGDGDDSLSVSGTVSGSGTVDLCGGEDTLTLNDGAVLATTISGGGHGSGDTVVLNNASALSFDGGNVVNFEKLQKDNTGEATLTGTQSFSGGTTVNNGVLTVAGSLETPTVVLADDTVLNVDGTLRGNGGGYAAIAGSAGANTVNVTAGALMQAGGDLGDGNDVLDVAGTLDTDGGTLALGAGDDMFVVHDTTAMLGTVDGGAGNDMLNVNVGTANTVPLGSLLGFESLGKSGDGTLQINGPSNFIDVAVQAGVLDVTAGGSIAAQNTTLASGATLQVDGAYTGTGGNDTLTVAGTVTGSGTVGLGDGNDTFTIQDGADLSGLLTPVDGGAGTDTFVADLAGEATLGGAINFETLAKTNTGTLHVDGPAPSAFATVTVDDGTLDIGVDGSLEGVQSAYLAMGTMLNVDGLFAGSDGDDVIEVAGTVTGSGTVALGDGDDRLVLMEGADLGGLANAVDGGAGTDTIQAQVDTSMVLGPTVNFETLYKGGNGTLIVEGDQAYANVQIEQGTLDVAVGHTLSSQDTMVNVGATLDVHGAFTGTAGDDTFVSMGTVNGALSFGAGNDSAHFVGGDLGGLTGVDGGAGSGDVLSFSSLELEADNFDVTSGWERVELLDNSSLTLASALDLQGATLFIDNTSVWTANDGASLTGSVENAGRIDVGANRVAISGGYNGANGRLQVTVSPANGTSGGLDIAGNVGGTTGVIFASDGTDVTAPTDILVISAANASAGAFVPAEPVDGFVRLEGSVFPWTFEQNGMDHNWYLGTDGGGVLPEIPGYAVLPTIGALMAQQGGDLVHQRLAGVRATDSSDCGPKGAAERAGAGVIDDCHGFWVATATNEIELGANPGFELSGDDVGLYMGFDQAVDRSDRILRFGGYLGLLRANYWTSGVNSTDLPGIGESEIDMDAPVGGLYFSNQWANGAYADVILSGQRPSAHVRTADGFNERLVGNSLTLSARAGWRYALQGGWTLEPQMQIDASQVHWQDTIDAGGRSLVIDDDVTSTARAGLRVEKAFKTAGGASIRPWATLAVQDTFGEKATGLEVTGTGPNATPQLFPNHDRGLAASLDMGVEAKLNEKVSLFGVISVGEDLEGTDYEHRAANAGVRVRW
ncbi:MAG TPA: autotransporter outer membrane beta-barrel domain-containing protein, partial [Pseudoxanthomonas sp.]|nr:autotransporter outer membrane beta-barrel domain-containing protein [Pseudoxanthomonas sp.]